MVKIYFPEAVSASDTYWHRVLMDNRFKPSMAQSVSLTVVNTGRHFLVAMEQCLTASDGPRVKRALPILHVY